MFRNFGARAVPLLCLGGLAVALRLPGLGYASLWWDECNTLSVARALGSAELPALTHALTGGLSTYFLVLAPWVAPDTSEALLRAPSVLAGCLLVLAVIWLGREVGGNAVGWWSGLVATLSPFLVWHAREARWYSWTWLLVALSTACLFRAARGGDWRWLGAFLALGLAASSTFWPAVTVPCTGLLWILGRRSLRRRLADSWAHLGAGMRAVILTCVGGCAAGLFGWAWMSIVAPVLAEGVAGLRFSNVGGPNPYAVAYTGIAFATGYTLGPGPSEWHTLSLSSVPSVDLLLIALGVGSMAGLLGVGVRWLRTTSDLEITGMAVGLVLVPLLLIVLACAVTDHTYAPRYAGISYPLVLVVMGAALEGRRIRIGAAVLAGLLLVLQLGSLWNLHYNARYAREDVRSAAAYVASRVGAGEAVLVFGGIDDPWRHYYNAPVPARIIHAAGGGMKPQEHLTSSLKGVPAAWVVSGRLWEDPGSEELMALVERWGGEIDRAGFPGGVEVRLYSP